MNENSNKVFYTLGEISESIKNEGTFPRKINWLFDEFTLQQIDCNVGYYTCGRKMFFVEM